MKIPVVLPTVHVHITDDGALRVDVDGEPHDVGRPLERGDLHTVLDQIAARLDCAVRVEVHEADGATYADIATPPEQDTRPTVEPTAPVTPGIESGISGTGFRPGEEIAIAYVVTRHTADDDGTAVLHLPPALLAANRDNVVLLGMASGRIASIDR